MEALFDTCKQLVAEITLSCLESEVYAAECLKLAKYVAKCALALTEVELYMREEQSLRGAQCWKRRGGGAQASCGGRPRRRAWSGSAALPAKGLGL